DLLLLINANATKIPNNQKDGPHRRNTMKIRYLLKDGAALAGERLRPLGHVSVGGCIHLRPRKQGQKSM
ncbi:hypothetical protein, partial [Tateyamaria pelophila]|uniref:hypothetical protein n=1 Tax=Tateyamaria pelophila TaxID=328415 RepID=UPI001CBBCD31